MTNEAGSNLLSIWPQDFISPNCLATISFDIAAPFFLDMGLWADGLEGLRAVLREKISRDPWILQMFATSRADQERWLAEFDAMLRRRASEDARQYFRNWVRDTYTLGPADRPNWEMYEMFFFTWAVHMRLGEDTAGCFDDPQAVHEAHCAFVRARNLKQRIAESRNRKLSAWDEKVFSIRGYTLVEADVDCDAVFDPFYVVESTSNLNYFRAFWEHLLPRLSGDERDGLLRALRKHYADDFRLLDLVSPLALTRAVL